LTEENVVVAAAAVVVEVVPEEKPKRDGCELCPNVEGLLEVVLATERNPKDGNSDPKAG
jgi:hypothetical protein